MADPVDIIAEALWRASSALTSSTGRWEDWPDDLRELYRDQANVVLDRAGLASEPVENHATDDPAAALVDTITRLVEATADLADLADAGAAELAARDALPDLAAAAVLVTDARRDLQKCIAALEAAAGAHAGKTVGTLPDGRQFRLTRARDRTAWDHEGWRRDVRRAVVEAVLHEQDDAGYALINLSTGEDDARALRAALSDAVRRTQEVHGASSPLHTALKALDLWADDYCTTSPGGWRIEAVAPDPT